MRIQRKIGLFVMLLLLTGCMTAPQPNHIDNICSIFDEYPSWRQSATQVERRWGVPTEVLMAIIYQESSFSADAKPPRTKLLWIIPWKRPSTAYGYSQALKTTWEDYKRSENRFWVRRDDFGDAADFIGWYINEAHRVLWIPKNDSYRLYLAYHEGLHGYRQKTYLNKPWLMNVAKRVQYQTSQYNRQLMQCPD